MKDDESIVLRIKELMRYLSLNQTEFSKESDIEQANLSAILNGKRKIGSAVTNKIVLAFDVNKAWLTTGEGERFRSNEARDAQTPYDQKRTDESNVYEAVRILTQTNQELLAMNRQAIRENQILEERIFSMLDQANK